MALSTIVTTLCFIGISRLSTVQSADITNAGRGTYECSGDCNIICSAYQGCYDSLFIITNTVPIWVNCTGDNACSYAVFYYTGSAYVDHVCDGYYACALATFYAFNPFHLNCKGGSYVCRESGLIDLVPPASGQVSITVSGLSVRGAYRMSVFSFYHQGQIFYCIESCIIGDIAIYYGLKFDEYCNADESSCISAQSAISDDVYGAYTIMDTLSGAYGTNYDFSAYTMHTNVLLVLATRTLSSTTFTPPTMDDSSAIVSVLCVECYSVTLDFSSVNNAILTGARMYASQNAVVEGPSGTFMVNSRHTNAIYSTQFNLDAYTNVAIRINALQTDTVNLGTNVDVEVNCVYISPYYGCNNVYLHSDVDPYSADLTNFIVSCGTNGCGDGMYVKFPTYAPDITCTFTGSGVSAGCEFLGATRPPTTYPSGSPSGSPSGFPTTAIPSRSPTQHPSSIPTRNPTRYPTLNPTQGTSDPTQGTSDPTLDPTQGTSDPTLHPTQGTSNPTLHSTQGTSDPTFDPTQGTSDPTFHPTTSYPSPNPVDGSKSNTEFTETMPDSDPLLTEAMLIMISSSVAVLLCILCTCPAILIYRNYIAEKSMLKLVTSVNNPPNTPQAIQMASMDNTQQPPTVIKVTSTSGSRGSTKVRPRQNSEERNEDNEGNEDDSTSVSDDLWGEVKTTGRSTVQ
eukprot:364649_1